MQFDLRITQFVCTRVNKNTEIRTVHVYIYCFMFDLFAFEVDILGGAGQDDFQ